MKESSLAEKITKALDFNLTSIFNEIDLKVKTITPAQASLIASMKPKKHETRIFVFSDLKVQNIKSKAVISFNKKNALRMVDLIKGAPFGTTKFLLENEINSLKSVSLNLFRAYVNSLNSVAGIKAKMTEPDVFFSFSSFENEFVIGNLKGKGKFFELGLSVGGTEIKGEMKFFAPIAMMK